MLEEEEVEEIVKEKRELPPEPEPVEEVKDSKENSRDDFAMGMKEGMGEVIIDFMIYVLWRDPYLTFTESTGFPVFRQDLRYDIRWY